MHKFNLFISRHVGGVLACMFAVAQSHAATIGLTLTSDKDPLTVTTGEMITFTVGMTPSEAITGYTLDIRYDMTELDFQTSAQVLPFSSGAFVPSFTLDPASTSGDASSTGLATSNSGRASVLQAGDSDPAGDLFSLTFTVLTPVSDGLLDLTVGLLNPGADAINPAVGGASFTINPDTVSASIRAVPVPAAFWLFGSGLLGLIGMARRNEAAQQLEAFYQRRRLRPPFLFLIILETQLKRRTTTSGTGPQDTP
ncbi:MAG: hypothetical protein WCH04_08365 [Gammaproteobacteria bacterium]